MQMNRRDFLKHSTLAAGSLLIPSFLKPLEAMSAPQMSGHRNLVIIQLSGGNDGLNTVVPYAMDEYYRHRQTIALPKDKLIRLNDTQGLHPAMAALREVYDQGQMGILNSVGYPNPNRSHFRSMDIWQSGSDASEYLSTGWIGRYLDASCPGSAESARAAKSAGSAADAGADAASASVTPYTALEVDDTLSLALKGERFNGMAVKNADQLHRNTRDPFFRGLLDNQPEHLNEDNLGYLYKTMAQTRSSAQYIQETSKIYKSKAQYPGGGFASQLKTVAQFICSGLQTRVYYVSLSGFDTHTGQLDQQHRLLLRYSEAMAAFIKELKDNDRLKDTLVMTFSEFGRRVGQNASNGTDHGTANNVFLFGGSLRQSGVLNAAPDLSKLDNGDLKYRIDFREVYATVLEKWLQTDNMKVLGRRYKGLGFV